MTEPTTVARSALGRLDYLAKGGTAVIYRLPQFHLPGLPPVVFKEYLPKTLAFAGAPLRRGLINLVQQRQRMTDRERIRWDRWCTWALRTVDDDQGAACGILLPLIPPEFFQDLRSRTGEVSTKPREVDLLFGDTADMSRQGLPAADPRQRLMVARQIARACVLMHDRDVVFGDLSGRNLVYDLNGSRPRIMVVDTDGARVEGRQSAFGGQAQTPHWEPPEALHATRRLRAAQRQGDRSAMNSWQRQTMIQNRATDVYKIGLMLVRVIDHGRGKAVNRRPEAAVNLFHQRWGRPAAEMLERSLSPAPSDRPTATELFSSLRREQPAQVLPSRRRPQAAPPIPPTPPPYTPDPRLPAQHTPAIEDGTVAGSFIYRTNRGWVRNTS